MNCLFMALILDSLLFTPVMGVGKSLDVNKNTLVYPETMCQRTFTNIWPFKSWNWERRHWTPCIFCFVRKKDRPTLNFKYLLVLGWKHKINISSLNLSFVLSLCNYSVKTTCIFIVHPKIICRYSPPNPNILTKYIGRV